jgi:hypothetical protein
MFHFDVLLELDTGNCVSSDWHATGVIDELISFASHKPFFVVPFHDYVCILRNLETLSDQHILDTPLLTKIPCIDGV